MFLINQVTSDPLQKQTLILPDGTSLIMTISFLPLQYGWFITEMIYGSFALEGVRIVVSPNILQQFKNQIPFGLGCFGNNVSREPTQQQDFSSQTFSLYILDSNEVTEFGRLLAGIPVG